VITGILPIPDTLLSHRLLAIMIAVIFLLSHDFRCRPWVVNFPNRNNVVSIT